MTVSSTTARASYTGNGTTTVFAVPFYFLAAADLRVILRTGTTEVVQTLTTNYTVTGAGVASGGSVTMLVAPAAGTTLTILRNTPTTQETDLLPNDRLPAESLETALDKLTMLVQQVDEVADRALQFPASDAAASPTIPAASARASKFLSFDSNGLPVATVGVDATLDIFTQAGSGAVPRSVNSKLRDTVSVKDFGAVGDGVTNDAPAIQAAINAVSALGGGRVYIPQGSYLINNTITVTQPFIHIAGDGMNTVLISGSSITAVFDYTSGVSPSGYGSLSNMRINQPNTTANFAAIVLGTQCYNQVISGIYCASNVITSTQVGIKFTTSNTHGSYYHTIRECLIYGFDVGIQATGTGSQGNGANSVVNTKVLVCNIGMHIGGTTLDGCYGWTIVGCWIGSCNTTSIKFGAASGSNFVYGLFSENYVPLIPAIICDAGSRSNYIQITHGGYDDTIVDNGDGNIFFETPTSDGINGGRFSITGNVRFKGPHTMTLEQKGTVIKRWIGRHHVGGWLNVGYNARAYDGSSADLDDSATGGTMARLGLSTFQFSRYDPGTNPRPDINMLYLEGDGFTFYNGSKTKGFRHGTATLVAGTVTVNDSSITASTRIFLTGQNTGGTAGWLHVSSRSVGTSFTITSSSATDTGSVAYLLIEPP
jgi:hypothetical protein